MNNKTKKIIITISTILITGLIGFGVWYSFFNQSSSTTSTISANDTIATTSDSSDSDWSNLTTTEVTLSDGAYSITAAGIYVLSGTSSASVNINTDGNVKIILNNAKITSSTGAAIYVENAKNVIIELADGTENYISDASTRSDETIDGAIYSCDDLTFTGNGQLTVKSNFADAIVSKDDLTINAGTIIITSADEGIRGKDSVQITGGTITIDSVGDGIKSTNDTETDKGYVNIKGGTITINSDDDGINAYSRVVIDDGIITIESSVEGIEGTNVTINGGTVNVTASDDGINAASDISGADIYVKINGGTINVTVGQGDTDGIDANGAIYINGGTIYVTAQVSSFDYDTTAEFNGGTIYVNGTQVDSIPVSQMGGGGMR